MLAPIITKDMRLFPSRPLPSNIKNVRSRAQSLDQLAGLQSGSSFRYGGIPVAPRNSASMGNLPSVARSPPTSSVSRKTTLSAIQEGVELKTQKSNSSSAGELSIRNGIVPSKKMTPTQAARLNASKQQTTLKLSGSSSDSASDDGGERKENKKVKKKSVVKWLRSMMWRSSRSDDEISPECISTMST